MKVLITRAMEPAGNTAMNLAAAGHEAVILPLVEYCDVPAGLQDDDMLSRRFDGMALTGAAAIGALERRFADQKFPQTMLDLPVFCVGTKTADAASRAGFQTVHTAAGDVISLATLIETKLPAQPGTKISIFHPAPRHKHENLAELLDGHVIEELTVYEARLVDPGRQTMEDALNAVAQGAAFFYSRRTATHFLELMSQHELQEKIGPVKFVAISPNVAQVLQQLMQVREEPLIVAAKSPNEDEMISCLSAFA